MAFKPVHISRTHERHLLGVQPINDAGEIAERAGEPICLLVFAIDLMPDANRSLADTDGVEEAPHA